MRNAGGYACITDPDNGLSEYDTFTCFHCNYVVTVKYKAYMDRIGSMCRICMKMVCARCAAGGCTPLDKKLDACEKRDRALRSYVF